ncbi:putative pentatricopeptide repeat-containing protein-like isoform 2 [Capsicum annuum]|uniref:Pentatricopeptide repeat-containing protein n=1 Tax=Capsicum annuum TaxID=4072 RepID=A0A2G2Y6L8_CAPAN|nr:putative pentatricopeptide repeat-containing protein-like isoform 2 [Capsicum annuum]KAF3634299.1 putative pentatricopeptide repeat-containing protein-like isoform 2 [Capsicum annuum]PHT65407.1 hypothetical protein T459_29832 [Capsicum annuum]
MRRLAPPNRICLDSELLILSWGVHTEVCPSEWGPESWQIPFDKADTGVALVTAQPTNDIVRFGPRPMALKLVARVKDMFTYIPSISPVDVGLLILSWGVTNSLDLGLVKLTHPEVYIFGLLRKQHWYEPRCHTYAKLLCCTKVRRFGRIEYILAEMVFLGIECTSVTYNTIIDGYSKAKLFELMESSLTNMIDSETAFPDVFTLGNLRKWRSGMKNSRNRFYSPTVMSYNIIIETLGKAGLIKNMEQFFLQMKHEGMKPTSFTYCSLVSAYSRAELLENVDSIMRQVGNSDVVLDTPFFNCIINTYGQAGDIERMVALFLEMQVRKCKPDHITYSTMIQAYNSQGIIEAANDLKTKMITSCGTLSTHTI